MKFSLFLFSTVLLAPHASLDKSLRGVSKMGKAGKGGKTNVCHYDEDEGTFKTISISDNALDAHKNHGDFVCDGLDNIVGCDAVDGCVCVEGYEFKGEDGCVDSCADMDCDDNDPETVDTCSLGLCSNVDSCADVDCDDNDPETVDTCSLGLCSNVDSCADVDCDDNDPETVDTCSLGVCSNVDSCADVDCDDNDAETIDTCSLGVCSNVDSCADVDCDDNDAETIDTCSLGVCSNVDSCAGVDCDDGNDETIDTCSLGLCSNVDSCADVDCDDNDAETVDTCSLGVCSNVDSCADVDCDDNDPETVDTCSLGLCSNVDSCVDVDCDDGIDETVDTCSMGECSNMVVSFAGSILNVPGGFGCAEGDETINNRMSLACETSFPGSHAASIVELNNYRDIVGLPSSPPNLAQPLCDDCCDLTGTRFCSVSDGWSTDIEQDWSPHSGNVLTVVCLFYDAACVDDVDCDDNDFDTIDTCSLGVCSNVDPCETIEIPTSLVTGTVGGLGSLGECTSAHNIIPVYADLIGTYMSDGATSEYFTETTSNEYIVSVKDDDSRFCKMVLIKITKIGDDCELFILETGYVEYTISPFESSAQCHASASTNWANRGTITIAFTNSDTGYGIGAFGYNKCGLV